MNTKTAKKMAAKRHAFMQLYLRTFRAELAG
jgi:HD superfamily phosphodiesterase